MRLKSIRVRNYRCLVDCSFSLRDFSSLIGPNNSGKSSLLKAIEVFLNQGKPELEEWHKDHEEEDIIIEGCFEEIQDWERNAPGVAGIVHNNEIRLRMIATRQTDGRGEASVSQPKYEAFVREEIIQGWSENWGGLSTQIKETATESGIDGKGWRTASNKERVRQALREKHPELVAYGEEVWTSESISMNAALKQAIPQAVLIEAVKDASDDAKPVARTTFGMLMSRLVLPTLQVSQEYQELLRAVDALNARIRGLGVEKLESVRLLEQELHNRMKSIIEAKAIITLGSPDADKFITGSTSIRVDDGIETPIHLQGHGVQRALIFALIEVLARQDAVVDAVPEARKQRATLLLFEEPELYIHPHLMRRLKSALQDIAQRPDWQVIISTHSPFLIDVATDPLSLIVLRRTNSSDCPRITQLESDPFGEDDTLRHDREALRAALDFHPTVTEAFFATRVVLVEGDTEVAVLGHSSDIVKLAGIEASNKDYTTIVSCGGKWTIPAMAMLLGKFEIPYRVIHDLDKKGRTDDELSNLPPVHPYRANARIRDIAGEQNILVIDDTFEHVFGDRDDVPAGAKPYRAWQMVREICQADKGLDDYPRLAEVIRFAFNW